MHNVRGNARKAVASTRSLHHFARGRLQAVNSHRTRSPPPPSGCTPQRQRQYSLRPLPAGPGAVLLPAQFKLSSFFKAQTHQLQSVNQLPVPYQPRSSLISRAAGAIRTLTTMAEPLNSRGGKVEVLASALEKPLLDTREYRVIKLPNDLEALLIHDPETDKAAAAMDVNIGSFSDPEDMPGMAHAVEHLLFMGTEKVYIEVFFRCEEVDELTSVYVVSRRERLQFLPDQVRRSLERVHRRDLDQLLFRTLRFLDLE